MTNPVNEYLKQRPILGTVLFVAMVLIATLGWVVILRPSRSVEAVLSNGGIWLVIGLIAVPSGVGYCIVSKRT